MFENGYRKREYTSCDTLPSSGRLIPEFDRRRSIKDMFSRTSSLQKKPKETATVVSSPASDAAEPPRQGAVAEEVKPASSLSIPGPDNAEKGIPRKRSHGASSSTSRSPVKRMKSTGKPAAAATLPGQKSLKGFFNSQGTAAASGKDDRAASAERTGDDSTTGDCKTAVDRIASKENWTRLFTKSPPRCEGHEEPCICLTTKKAGINCGRSFWICRRPVGPSGNKEKDSQWRCSTFIWASDW